MGFKIWYSDVRVGEDKVEVLVVCVDFRAEGCSLDTRKSMNHVYNERFPGRRALLMRV